MKYVYPAIFRREGNGTFYIFFPDIGFGGTQGDDMADGISMAEDFLGNAMVSIEDEAEAIPKPSTQKELLKSDEYEDGDIITFIQTNTVAHRKILSTALIKKTLVVPAYLNEKAIRAGINFSQLLQEALREELQLTE